jgi:hypothetical protein
VLTSQLLAFDALDSEWQNVKHADAEKEGFALEYSKEKLPEYIRFTAEEVMRRMQKKDASALTKDQILKVLFGPDWSKRREELKNARVEEVKADSAQAVGHVDTYAKF